MKYVKIVLISYFKCHRIEKERAKFQQEVYELLSQIEIINKEKVNHKICFKILHVHSVETFRQMLINSSILFFTVVFD